MTAVCWLVSSDTWQSVAIVSSLVALNQHTRMHIINRMRVVSNITRFEKHHTSRTLLYAPTEHRLRSKTACELVSHTHTRPSYGICIADHNFEFKVAQYIVVFVHNGTVGTIHVTCCRLLSYMALHSPFYLALLTDITNYRHTKIASVSFYIHSLAFNSNPHEFVGCVSYGWNGSILLLAPQIQNMAHKFRIFISTPVIPVKNTHEAFFKTWQWLECRQIIWCRTRLGIASISLSQFNCQFWSMKT